MKRVFIAVALSVAIFSSALASGPRTFSEAKVVAKQEIFFDQAAGPEGELYCGCQWKWVGKSGGRVDAESCGYEVRKQPTRAERTEWEHIVPAWTFGHQRQCWQNGGRKNCVATDPVFRAMEADLLNLYPSVGEVNGDRGHFNYGMVTGVPPQYGQCATRIDFNSKTAEPRDEVKGLVARTTFYMFDRYNLNMSRQQQQLLMTWSRQHPVSAWEMKRNDRVAKLTGHSNPFVTGERVWTIGHKPTGEGIKTRIDTSVPSTPAKTEKRTAQGDLSVIGNRRSRVYHLSAGCPGYGQTLERNRIYFSSEAEAVGAGFRKAGNCK